MIEKGDCAIFFDLKSGYHHIDIHADYWQYLGFSWKGKDGVIVYYMFRVLPLTSNSSICIYQVAQATGKEMEKIRVKRMIRQDLD